MERPGILLIEDDYDEATQMMRVLKKYRIANYVEALKDGEDALRLVRDGPAMRAELVLMDFTQPGMPAMQLIRRLRGLTGMEAVPIIVCCGSPAEEQSVKQWGFHRVTHMSKPAGFFKLLECIQKLEMHWQVFASKPA